MCCSTLTDMMLLTDAKEKSKNSNIRIESTVVKQENKILWSEHPGIKTKELKGETYEVES